MIRLLLCLCLTSCTYVQVQVDDVTAELKLCLLVKDEDE